MASLISWLRESDTVSPSPIETSVLATLRGYDAVPRGSPFQWLAARSKPLIRRPDPATLRAARRGSVRSAAWPVHLLRRRAPAGARARVRGLGRRVAHRRRLAHLEPAPAHDSRAWPVRFCAVDDSPRFARHGEHHLVLSCRAVDLSTRATFPRRGGNLGHDVVTFFPPSRSRPAFVPICSPAPTHRGPSVPSPE